MINKALTLIRKYHDENLTVAAQNLGVSKSHLSEVESGKKNPSMELLGKYSVHYKMPLSAIMFFAENNASEVAGVGKIRRNISTKAVRLLEWVEEIT